MTYDEFYKMVIDYFNEHIDIDNKELKLKTLNSFIAWYNKNYQEEIKKCYEDNNQLRIINIAEYIKKVINLDRESFLKVIYIDENYEEFLQLSKKIYDLAKEALFSNKFNLTIDEYNSFKLELDKYEEKISVIFKNDYYMHKSECYLDLEYLINKGNVNAYSIRIGLLLE